MNICKNKWAGPAFKTAHYCPDERNGIRRTGRQQVRRDGGWRLKDVLRLLRFENATAFKLKCKKDKSTHASNGFPLNTDMFSFSAHPSKTLLWAEILDTLSIVTKTPARHLFLLSSALSPLLSLSWHKRSSLTFRLLLESLLGIWERQPSQTERRGGERSK